MKHSKSLMISETHLLMQVLTFYYPWKTTMSQKQILKKSLGHVAYQDEGLCYWNTTLWNVKRLTKQHPFKYVSFELSNTAILYDFTIICRLCGLKSGLRDFALMTKTYIFIPHLTQAFLKPFWASSWISKKKSVENFGLRLLSILRYQLLKQSTANPISKGPL